ncbi:hypothetical protein H4219_005467 [Mycoemilia scoparia]|uniref:Haloacid dehalogenase-like hydrolase domain-containing protein 3 n=1 Tax=Mycoemilia scoparia TaxID=417184 RepID=A0A9W7ZW09_9FUNG|nr:hypothetical protein H4219_005467 [Mycoemilia scoparia]
MSRPAFNHIRLITFDAFNTLYVPKENETVEKSFSKAFKNQYKLYPNYGIKEGLTSSGWWKEVIRQTWFGAGVEENVIRDLLPKASINLLEKFSCGDGYDMYPDVPKILKMLKHRGIRLGVISNSDERTGDILKSFDLYQYFDFVQTSVDIGVEKPEPEIFETALRAMGISACEALHIGDDLMRDYYGAKGVGMEALVIDRTDLEASKKDPYMYVHSLYELIPMLKSS